MTDWKRMQFKDNKVWLQVDDAKRPIVKDGKVLIKYNLKQDYQYWVHAANVVPIGSDPPPAADAPASGAAKNDPSVAVDNPRTISIYTDGASSGNPGPAGIGVVLIYGRHRKEISRFLGKTTNNVAELTAIEVALAAVQRTDLPVRIYTDSAYAQGVLTLGWKAKKNAELIQQIKGRMTRFEDLKIIKIRGHAGVAENERADKLAVGAIADHK